MKLVQSAETRREGTRVITALFFHLKSSLFLALPLPPSCPVLTSALLAAAPFLPINRLTRHLLNLSPLISSVTSVASAVFRGCSSDTHTHTRAPAAFICKHALFTGTRVHTCKTCSDDNNRSVNVWIFVCEETHIGNAQTRARKQGNGG